RVCEKSLTVLSTLERKREVYLASCRVHTYTLTLTPHTHTPFTDKGMHFLTHTLRHNLVFIVCLFLCLNKHTLSHRLEQTHTPHTHPLPTPHTHPSPHTHPTIIQDSLS